MIKQFSFQIKRPVLSDRIEQGIEGGRDPPVAGLNEDRVSVQVDHGGAALVHLKFNLILSPFQFCQMTMSQRRSLLLITW